MILGLILPNVWGVAQSMDAGVAQGGGRSQSTKFEHLAKILTLFRVIFAGYCDVFHVPKQRKSLFSLERAKRFELSTLTLATALLSK